VPDNRRLYRNYGDTDSVFLANGALDERNLKDTEWIISETKARTDVELKLDKIFELLVLTKNRKQYFGLIKDPYDDTKLKIISKVMTGMKSDKHKLSHDISEHLIGMESILQIYYAAGRDETKLAQARENITHAVRSVFAEIEEKISADGAAAAASTGSDGAAGVPAAGGVPDA